MSIFLANNALNHPPPEGKQQQQPGLISALLCTTVKPFVVQVTKQDPEQLPPTLQQLLLCSNQWSEQTLQPDSAGNV